MAHSPDQSSQPEPSLLEELCASLAFHVVETELTLHFTDGDVAAWRAACERARELIRKAGFDIDVLYPVEDRPTGIEAHG